MNTPSLCCQTEPRRGLTRASTLFGLDYLEVSADQLTLTVVFLGRAPQNLVAANVVILGGERITDIKVTTLTLQPSGDPALDDSMLVTVDQPGDFSPYCLCVRALDTKGRPTNDPMPGFDPRYACVKFSFKASCPSDLDCKAASDCAPPVRSEPEINYLAKDYDSFRQLIYDRLAVIMPGWQERHVPDVGVTLVELLAYAGDQLSYYQDAVATEAYLGTARLRISVRRHARLVDYLMHEGCNARTWVCLQPKADFHFTANDAAFLTALDDTPALADKTVLSWADLNGVRSDSYEVFEPLVASPDATLQMRVAHNSMDFYTWGNRLCSLPAGTTKATLLDGWATPAGGTDGGGTGGGTAGGNPSASTHGNLANNGAQTTGTARRLQLQAGDVLIFEEVKGPRTGNPADADPAHRWAVRLISVAATTDPLIKTADGRPTPLVEIEWAAVDALPFAFCLSVRLPAPDCRVVGCLSVARGNIVLVDHGRTIVPPEDLGVVEQVDVTGCCACEGSVIEVTPVPGPFRPALQQTPLTYCDPANLGRAASKTLTQDPRQAAPAIVLHSIPSSLDGTAPLFPPTVLQDLTALAGMLKVRTTDTAKLLYELLSAGTKSDLDAWDGTSAPPPVLVAEIVADLVETWIPARDLLESGPDDGQFVVEMDDDGVAHLRFGDGINGRQPEAGMDFQATYRIGNGTAGNIGADRITRIVFRTESFPNLQLTLRNPLPAQGGIDPEPVAEVKLFAPGAFKTVLKRAITPADYATLAKRSPKLQNAKADLRWTGSWYEAQVAVDPLDSETPDDPLLRHIQSHLRDYRRLGHDLVVDAARYVPLQVTLAVCVLPQYLRGHVEAALRDVFSNRVLANGQLGFFHPDNLTFGEGVYLSKIVAAAQAVPGVQAVEVTAFNRLYDPPGDAIKNGLLPLGPMEIARLDNDPSFPEHGSLTLNLRGGR